MLLRPRKFPFKTIQKPRTYIHPKRSVVPFGPVSIFTKQPLFLTSHKMFRVKLFLKKSARKADKTKRYFWINLFPYLPLSKKVLGSRMGKGKGKAHSWFMQIPACTNVMSFKNLRLGRFYYFFTQVQHKLRTPLKYKHKYRAHIILGFRSSIRIGYSAFW